MLNIQELNSIYSQLNDLNRRKDWSIYCYDELMHDIMFVHNSTEMLVNCYDSEEIELDNYNRLENYIELGSQLENTINRAILRLKYGYDIYIEE